MKTVTVAGNVFHGGYSGAGQPTSGGDVKFSNDQYLISMQRSDGDGWLTGADADWLTPAGSAWNGGLKDQSHNVRPWGLPTPVTVDPPAVIERADSSNDSCPLKQEKFEYKAGLKMIADSSGQPHAVNPNGTELPLIYPDPQIAACNFA